jgi:uncharacterized protein (DUF58 family)
MFEAWKARWRRWIDARSPRQASVTLTQRNVYIMPGKGGLVYASVAGVLLLGAINEQLNLAYALAFLLGGVGLSAMWLTHRNLLGVTLTLGGAPSVHAGQALIVTVMLQAGTSRRGRYGLRLNDHVDCEVAAGQQASASLSVPTTCRGWLTLPRWRIDTTYPLGLFRAWAYWRAAPAVLIWPALDHNAPPLPVGTGQQGDRPTSAPTVSEAHPDEVREWRQGDSLRTVAWKKSATRMASGLPPLSRYNPAQARQQLWIDWEDAPGLATEARLSRLAAWLLMAEQHAHHTGQIYGLRLPDGVSQACGQGSAHLQQCMNRLAEWGLPQGGRDEEPRS